MEDSGILELYFLRNEQAIQETERKYGAYCKTIAGRILKNREDTEETVNDTWLSAWNAIPPQKPNCLQGFLGRITRNGAIDRWRRRTAEKRGGEMELALEELGECIPSGDQVEREVEARELGRVLEQFLGTLPEERRRMFLLRYWYLMPNREIAQRLGWTESRVRIPPLRPLKKPVVPVTTGFFVLSRRDVFPYGFPYASFSHSTIISASSRVKCSSLI